MFRIGDDVVCINAKPIDIMKLRPPLVEGDIYTIEDVAEDMVDVGLKTSTGDPWYVAASRFAPLTEFTMNEVMAKEHILEHVN